MSKRELYADKDANYLLRKATKAINLARLFFGPKRLTGKALEDQAYLFMSMSEEALLKTARRALRMQRKRAPR